MTMEDKLLGKTSVQWRASDARRETQNLQLWKKWCDCTLSLGVHELGDLAVRLNSEIQVHPISDEFITSFKHIFTRQIQHPFDKFALVTTRSKFWYLMMSVYACIIARVVSLKDAFFPIQFVENILLDLLLLFHILHLKVAVFSIYFCGMVSNCIL